MQEKAHDKSNNLLLKAFTKTVAWSLLGTTDWKTNPHLKQASVVPAVTENYPPTYITDGNTLSFAPEGEALAKRLKELNVPVSELFFNDSSKKLDMSINLITVRKSTALLRANTPIHSRKYPPTLKSCTKGATFCF